MDKCWFCSKRPRDYNFKVVIAGKGDVLIPVCDKCSYINYYMNEKFTILCLLMFFITFALQFLLIFLLPEPFKILQNILDISTTAWVVVTMIVILILSFVIGNIISTYIINIFIKMKCSEGSKMSQIKLIGRPALYSHPDVREKIGTKSKIEISDPIEENNNRWKWLEKEWVDAMIGVCFHKPDVYIEPPENINLRAEEALAKEFKDAKLSNNVKINFLIAYGEQDYTQNIIQAKDIVYERMREFISEHDLDPNNYNMKWFAENNREDIIILWMAAFRIKKTHY